MLQLSNNTDSIRKQRSAAQLRPFTPRARRISGSMVVDGMLAAQNSPSPPPESTAATTTTTTIGPTTSLFNETPSPPLAPQPTQDYISAYRSSQQIMVDYARFTNNTPFYDEHEGYLVPIDSADCSMLSVVSEAFVRQLGHQEIFTGEEAANALHGLLASAYYPEYRSIEIANALMHCKPHVLFQPLEDYGNPPQSNVSFIPAWNQKYVLRYDSLEEETKPSGVLSSLSPCYVNGCKPGNIDCYAPRCPNNPGNAMREILRSDQSTPVPTAVRSLLHDNVQIDVDSSITVSVNEERNVLTGINHRQDSNSSYEGEVRASLEEAMAEKREKARQKAILKLIRSHQSYCKKLDILHHVIVDSILSNNTIGKLERRKSLVSNAFSTYDTLRSLNKDMKTDMVHRREQSQDGKISKIGDIFYYHIKLMSEPLIDYVTNIPLADYIIENECTVNPNFIQVLEQAKQNKLFADTGITAIHYIYLAPRMQIPQYMKCLREILDHTPEDHPDFDLLKRCNEKVERIERESKKQANRDTEQRVQALKLADSLISVPPDVDLDLAAPQRRLFYHGAFKKSSSITIRKKMIHFFVLNHMVLLTTTIKQRDTKHTFLDYILLPMLHVQESKTNFIARPSSSSSSSSGGDTRRRKISLLNNSSQEDLSPTITLVHLGRNHQKPRVFSCSIEEKKRCLEAIDQARKQYKNSNKNRQPFGLDSLNHSAFRVYYEMSSRNGGVAGYDKVNCSVPLGTEDGMILVGTNTGVYSVHNHSITAETLLPIGKVTQMAFMREAGLLLVLTVKQELKAYTIESIIGGANERYNGYTRAPQSICIDYYVQYFQVGSTQHHKDLLIYMKRRHLESVLVAVKPIDDLYNGSAARDRAVLSSPQYFTNRPITSISPPQGYIFRRVHQDNIRATGVRTVQFCGDGNVALVCQNNFRFFSFGEGEPHERRSSLPFDDKRRKDENSIEARAAFYLAPDRILLCYNRYGYLIDEHHNPIPSANSNGYLFKFESEPENIVRHKEYIIGFSEYFIEIRSLNSGELVQIVHADSCQLTYEGMLYGEHVIHGCKVESHGTFLDRQQLFQLTLHT